MFMDAEKQAAPGSTGQGLAARLVKRLERFVIDVDIRCPAGRLLAVVGPSGAGKTRLLRCLAGLEQPDEGRILVDGECWLDTAARRRLPPQRRSAGLLFQEYGLFPHMTVRENVAFAAHPACDVDGLLATFGIAELRARKPAALSGGERQRAALCQAIARRPRLLLLDEPFSALDMENRFALRAELLRLKEAWGMPMLYVTHDLSDALAVGDEVLALREGRADPSWLERQTGLLRRDQDRLRRRLGPRPATSPPSPFPTTRSHP
ncbi:ATP-binding cassette domain-containing protein [Desulfovibrio sp.]